MKLEQRIHAELLHKVGGLQKNIKGISQTTLSKMKRGNSGINTRVLKKIFEANGIDGTITLSSEEGSTTTIKF